MVDARVGPTLLLLSLAACGPEAPPPPLALEQLEPLELPPICGQPGPFRLLALDQSETPVDRDSAVYRFEDRLYFVVGRRTDPENADFDPYEIGRDGTLYSTGPCGESPRVLATNIWGLLEHPRWPGSLLATTHQGDLVVVDPEGEAEPRLLIEDVPRSPAWTEHGMLVEDDERGALVLRPYPSSPDDVGLEPTVLIEPFASDADWDWHGDELLFVEDGVLHRLDLRDGSRAVELERDGGIEGLTLVADGRFLVLESPPSGDGLRSVEIYDRLLGIGEPVGDTDIDILVEDRGDHLLLWSYTPTETPQRLVLLPSMNAIDMPPAMGLGPRIDDTRWRAYSRPNWLVYDRTTGTTRSLFEWPGKDSAVPGESWDYDDRIEVLVPEWFASGFTRQGPLYAAWFDGRGHERIADQATPGLHHLADGRLVTPLGVHHRAVGTLALTGLDGVTRWVIDTETLAWFGQFQAPAGFEDDVVVYAVSDGDRSGVWVARLPPAQ